MWGLWIAAAIVLTFGFVVFRGAPYVPTRKRDLDRAFDDVYPLADTDVLVDIGSGDGVVLRQAAKRGATAIGYELNPILVLISRFLSRNQPNVRVVLADFWRAKLPDDTTIVYTFGETRDIGKMCRKVEREATRLKRPLYFMSFGFPVEGRDVVKPDRGFYLYRILPQE